MSGSYIWECPWRPRYMEIKDGQVAIRAKTDIRVYKIMVTWPWRWLSPIYGSCIWFPWKGRRITPDEEHFELDKRRHTIGAGGITAYISFHEATRNYRPFAADWKLAPVSIVEMVIPKGVFYYPSADGKMISARALEIVKKCRYKD